MANRTLYLYTTVGCSLCEKAKQSLWRPLGDFSLTLSEVDIVDHPALLPLLATTIPVISLVSPTELDTSQPLLNWPFSEQQVSKWLHSLA